MTTQIENYYYKLFTEQSDERNALWEKLPLPMRLYDELSKYKYKHLIDILEEIYEYASQYPLENNANWYSDPCMLQEYLRSLTDLGLIERITSEAYHKLMMEEIEETIKNCKIIYASNNDSFNEIIKNRFNNDKDIFIIDRRLVSNSEQKRINDLGIKCSMAYMCILSNLERFIQCRT